MFGRIAIEWSKIITMASAYGISGACLRPHASVMMLGVCGDCCTQSLLGNCLYQSNYHDDYPIIGHPNGTQKMLSGGSTLWNHHHNNRAIIHHAQGKKKEEKATTPSMIARKGSKDCESKSTRGNIRFKHARIGKGYCPYSEQYHALHYGCTLLVLEVKG